MPYQLPLFTLETRFHSYSTGVRECLVYMRDWRGHLWFMDFLIGYLAEWGTLSFREWVNTYGA